jgi:hypothetical protein
MCVVAGCSDLFGPAGQQMRVTTDRTSYEATYVDGEGAWTRYSVDVVVRTVNVGRSPLYISSCSASPASPVFGVVQVSGNGEGGAHSAFSPVWACPGFPPIQLAPGEIRLDTLRLMAPNGVNGITGQVMGSLEGTKKIGWDVRTCPDRPDCGAAGHVGLSNGFEVTLPGG